MPRFARLRSLYLFLACLVLATLPVRAVVLTSQEQGIADRLVNASGQHRASMQMDPILTAVARARASDMANRRYFDHVNPDGKAANYLIRQAGYQLPASWPTADSANNVESIAAGRASAADTWEDWMNSAPHKDHLLANNAFYASETSYGVGYAMKAGSPYIHYWVVITAPPQPVPKLEISTPAEGAHLNAPTVTLAGKTGADSGAVRVVYRVENSIGNGLYLPATGLGNWTAEVTGLLPGTNTLRVRSLGATGAVIAESTQTVVYTVFKPLAVQISGSGAVTAGFLGATDRQLNKAYTITATPADGMLFAGWTGTLSGTSKTVTFTMVEGMTLRANFILNPFLAHLGGFTGLVTGDQPGLVRLHLAANGGFTGKLRYADRAYPLNGRLLANGTATVKIARAGASPLVLNLALDLATGDTIQVSIDDGGRKTTVVAAGTYREPTGFPGAGRYTVALPATVAASAPAGNGCATLVIDSAGRAQLNGFLANGTPMTFSGSFTGSGVLSLLVPLNHGDGNLAGNLILQATATSDLHSTLHWSKPATATIAVEADLAAVGSRYVPPALGDTVLDLNEGGNNGALTLQGGDLPRNVVQPVTIDDANEVTSADAELAETELHINPANGRFSGSFIHPGTGRRSRLHGVILQKQNAGFGFFNGEDESGAVSLAPSAGAE